MEKEREDYKKIHLRSIDSTEDCCGDDERVRREQDRVFPIPEVEGTEKWKLTRRGVLGLYTSSDS